MNTKIIDVHTHAFPDFLAEKAIFSLAENSKEYKPFTDGTINGLLESMKKSGIEKSFIANIATKPEQVIPILDWSKKIHSNKIIPLGSIYPKSDTWKNDIDLIKAAGLPGIKLHPMYQDFYIDEKFIYPIFEYICEKNLFILMHSGYDIAFPDDKRAFPYRILNIIRFFPDIKIIAAHVGGWRDWENVVKYLVGEEIFIETSFIGNVDDKIRKIILKKHDRNKILFGTDSPWLNQKDEVQEILNLKISADFKEKIFFKNAESLLKSVSYGI